jgi:hypothetical protein
MAKTHSLQTAFALSIVILCIGCGHTGFVSVTEASGPIPFPAIPTDGTPLVLRAGVYTCPTVIPTGAHIVGLGSVAPPELVGDIHFAPFTTTGTVPAVRISCMGNLVLSNVANIQIYGVIFDFNNLGGMVMDGVIYSTFAMSIVNSPVGLTMTTTTGTTATNSFPTLIFYNDSIGMIMKGINSHAVTWNDFGNLELVNITDVGIIVSQFADTNTFSSIRMHLRGSARDGMVFNDAGALSDVDASGNIVRALDCDGEAGFAGACAHFKGYTVGNYIMLGFSTVPEQNKVVFDNGFSAGANSILKLQENPKQP